ncbi:MAG: ABC transporter substrate-binding protein [Rubricella sp.]
MKNWFAAVLAAAFVFTGAGASAEIVLSSLTYRTGPYAPNGIPFSDGFSDYVTLLNQRDGGINGVPIRVVECEYGYDTPRGLDCYREVRDQGALAVHPLSTGLSLELIPLTEADGIPLHMMGYGLTASSDGSTFRYGFNFPAHYWDAAAAQIRFLKEQNGGTLEGLRIMHLHHNSGYGREPIPTLEALAEIEGFELILQPIDHPGEDQSALWPRIMESAPDRILFWGWGVMNRVALESALESGYPIENMIGVWWSANEGDLRPLGDAAEGYHAVTFHAVGTDFEIYNEMNELVYFAGLSRGQMNNLGDAIYNRGIVAAIYMTEAVRRAMEIHGTTDVTPQMVRDGFEALSMDDAAYETLGMAGFTPPIEVTCADHGGAGMVAVTRWNALWRRWEQVTDYYEPNDALIEPQVAAASRAYADANGIAHGAGCN